MTYFKGGTAQGFQSYAPFSKFLYFHLEKKNCLKLLPRCLN